MTKKLIAATILLSGVSGAVLATPALSERITQVVSPYSLDLSAANELSSQVQNLLRLRQRSGRITGTTEVAEFARLTLVDENYVRLSPLGGQKYPEGELSKSQQQILAR